MSNAARRVKRGRRKPTPAEARATIAARRVANQRRSNELARIGHPPRRMVLFPLVLAVDRAAARPDATASAVVEVEDGEIVSVMPV